MENLKKFGSFKRKFVIGLICASIISSSMPSNQVGEYLPRSCSINTYPARLQVDLHCVDELPDFSRINFPYAPNVYQLVVQFCTFEFLHNSTFQGLTGMQHLFLLCEGSKQVPKLRFEDGLFEDLHSLKAIVLAGSNIGVLPDGIFCNVPSLTQLFLKNNFITLPKSLGFSTNCSSSYCRNNVTILTLSENSISYLPNRIFCSLTNLVYLDLSHNGLRSIEEDAFYNLGSLKTLDLSDNNLTSLPETTLKPLTGMYNLDLANNPNLNISGFLKYVPHLKGLFLPGIGLEFLDKNDFQGLHRVESLMLYDNRLHTVDEDVFEPFIGVVDDVGNETLLSQCEEDAINRLVFGGDMSFLNEKLSQVVNVTGLRYLNLDGNNFTSMPPIRKLFKLFVLSIARNQIEILDDGIFGNFRQLQRLTLSFNRIQFISQQLFANLTCLKQLLLDHNYISYIHRTAFHDLTSLSELHLQHNGLKDIRDIFGKNDNLKLLNLSYNLLEELSLEMLPSSLATLDISHNSIKHLVYVPNSLSKHRYMALLDLSNNQISAINRDFFPNELINLYLHANEIDKINTCTFCNLGIIEIITLHNNKLKTLHPDDLRINSLSVFGTTPGVTLSGNSFICDCYLQSIKQFTYKQNYLPILNFNELSCLREYVKNKPTMVSIAQTTAPEDFLCRIGYQNNPLIPETCSVYHDANWEFFIVDCSLGNLTLIPSKVYPGVVKLYLDGNNFDKLQNNVFQSQVHQNLTELYLNGSHIESIEDNIFIELAKLTHLNLQNNDLKYLSKHSFNGLHHLIELKLPYNNLMVMENAIFSPLPELMQLQLNNNQLRFFPVWELASSKSLSKISLGQNPWSCDCDFISMYRTWLQKRASAVVDLEALVCKFDNNSALGWPLISFNTAHCFQITGPGFLKSKHLPLLIGLITSLVLFSVVCLILYLYRREMQVLIYSRYGVRIFHKNDAQSVDGEKLYDAFICYSNSDEDFVVNTLLPNLEGIEPPFRCCMHRREFLVGGYITENILEAVSKSRRSILVLSEAFISSEWCHFEFRTAYVQMLNYTSNRVIVVVIGKIPEVLDPEMELCLKMNMCIYWGDKRFWEKLYFAMPDRTQATDSVKLNENGINLEFLPS